MKKVFSLGGYDVFELSKHECDVEGREFPTLCAFYNSWDEDCPGEEREVNRSESEFGDVQEAIDWCVEYRRGR
jgi:hypothetical protein